MSLGAAIWVVCTPAVRAADPPKKTLFVINEAVEVPGMVLDPGRYILKLVEPGAERNVLQVFEVVQLWTGDERRLLSTLLTMPNYDRPTTDKTVFTFFERSPKQAKALRLWFPPGRNCGQEFVYPKSQAIELAKAVGRGVLSMPPELPGDIGALSPAARRNNPEIAHASMPVPAAPLPAARMSPAAASTRMAPPTGLQTAPQKQYSAVPVSREPLPQKMLPQPASPPSTSVRVRQVAPSVPAVRDPAPVQSRSRAIGRTAPQTPLSTMASLPKTAGYLPLATVLGIAGIFGGLLLRVLALRLEHQ